MSFGMAGLGNTSKPFIRSTVVPIKSIMTSMISAGALGMTQAEAMVARKLAGIGFNHVTARKTYRSGKRAAEFMYKHRKAFLLHARKRRRVHPHFDRQSVGNPGGQPHKQDLISNTSGIIRNSRVLYQTDLTAIVKNDTNNDINKRERQLVFVVGFNVCLEIQNISSSALYFNIAVIAPKCVTGVGLETDFFRGYENERSVDFDPMTLTSLDFHCRPINTDRYTILKHQKLLLSKFESSTQDGGNRTAYTVNDMWIPLNRQIRYEHTSSNSSCDPVYMVFWMDKFSTGAGSSPAVGVATVGQQCRTVFKN